MAYWIVTILFAGFMIFSSASDVMGNKEAIKFITNLGYPEYFVYFISWAKIAGAIAILVPGFPRIKEWAYAGLIFDLTGATYSFYMKGYPVFGLISMLVFIAFGFASYFLYHKANPDTIGKMHVTR